MKNNSMKLSVALNMIKQGLTLLFPLITVPYVSQHLGVQGYGEYNYAASIVSYISYFAAMGISTYGVREGALHRNDKKQEEKLCSQLISINIMTTIISLVGMIVLCAWIRELAAERPYILVLSLSILFGTIGAEWINQIYEDFLFLTIRYVIMQVVSVILLFVLVKTPQDVVKYCYITVISSAGANLLNVFHVRKYVKIRFTWKMDFKNHFPHMFIFFLSSLATVVYVNSDITMLGSICGSYEAGLYSLSSKIYNIIKMLLYAIISTAIPKITALYGSNKVEYTNLTKKTYKMLTLIVIPAGAGLAALSTDIIVILGGKSYIDASTSLMILAAAIPFAIYGAFYSSYYIIVASNEKVVLWTTVISAGANIMLNVFLIPRIGINGAAITTVIAEFANYALSKWYVCRKKKIKTHRMITIPLILSVIILLGVRIVKCIFPSMSVAMCIIRCILIVLVTLIGYGLFLLQTKNKDIRDTVDELIPSKIIIKRRS